jgi:hypothetical protein
MVKKPEEYIWSSYGSYIGKSKPPSFLYVTEILAKFKGKNAYGQYVLSFLEDEKGIAQEDVYGKNSFLGSDGFIRQALSGFRGGKKSDGEVNDEKELRQVSTDNVLEVMMTILHIDDDDIWSRKKGNVYRKMFIYMLRKHTALSLREIGEMLGMKYRAVSELERYFSNELTEKKAIQKKVARIEKELKMMAFLGGKR